MSAVARFDELFAAHARDVHAYIARRHVGHDVEDLVADVFTVAWQRINEIPAGFELPWLYRTSWNLVSNNHRKISEISSDYIGELDQQIAEDPANAFVDLDQLGRVWRQLTVRDQEILRLAAWEELTGSELAQALNLSVGGAASALSRARSTLRNLWTQDISNSQQN